MGLKKLFTSSSASKSNKEEGGLKDYDKRRNTARSSTLSLTQSISNWTHHSKDKHHSLNITSNNKRYSQPSPPSSLSPPLVPKVTQDEIQRHSNNTTIVTSPVTPSDSMKDVNEVVNVLRNSVSSEMLNSTFSIEEEKEQDKYPPMIPIVDSNNPFVTEPQEKRQSQAFYPPSSQDSNKYEVLEEEEYHTNSLDATNKETGDNNDDALYTELLVVSSQIENTNPRNTVDIKNKLNELNTLLVTAADKSKSVHSKLTSIIELSKNAILSATDKNKELMETQEDLKLELQALRDGHVQFNAQRETELQQLLKENVELKQALQHTQTQLSRHKNNILQLIRQEEKEQLDNEEEEESYYKEIRGILSTFRIMESKYQQLIMKSENDERKFQSEMLASESKYTELMKEKDELLANHNDEEKLMLIESHYKNLLETETKQKGSLLNQVEQYAADKETKTDLQTKLTAVEAALKDKQLSSDKSEKVILELKENIKLVQDENNKLKQDMMDMEAVSKEAARTVIDENEKLEKRIHEIEESSSTKHTLLNEEIQSLTKESERINNENDQLKNDLKVLSDVKQENLNLTQHIKTLQSQIRELSLNSLKRQSSANSTIERREQDQQEELMNMHTKAQLGLIEYLEGEDNVVLAMARLKKGLEERI